MVFKNQIGDLLPWEPIDDNSGIRPTILLWCRRTAKLDWAADHASPQSDHP